MDKQINQFIQKMKFKPPVPEEYLKIFEEKLNINLPIQYKEFMLSSNGAVGFVGNSYLLIWSIEETLEINLANVNDETLFLNKEDHEAVICFGSDGGDMVYAFNKKSEDASIITFPLISIVSEEYELRGHTFNEFLQNLFYF